MSEQPTSSDDRRYADQVAEMSAEVISNAVNTEVKERYGEDFFVKHAIVVALVERPRGEMDRPDTPRFSLFLKNLAPVHPSIAVNMMREAVKQFQINQAGENE